MFAGCVLDGVKWERDSEIYVAECVSEGELMFYIMITSFI